MDNKKLLNEEQFQKNNKKVKTAGLIVIIVGIVMFLISFFIQVPEMGEEGWMELHSTMTTLRFLGVFIAIVGCMIRFFIGNQRQISAYMAQQQMPVAQEGLEKMAPSMGKAAKEVAKGVKEGLKDEEK